MAASEMNQAILLYNVAEEKMTKEELKLIYEFIEHFAIPYDNYELLLAVRKLARIINDNE